MPPPRSDQHYRDRTHEFQTIVERMRKSLSSSPNGSKTEGPMPPPPRSSLSVHSEFNKRASKIGLGIHQTSQKLSKLAMRKQPAVL